MLIEPRVRCQTGRECRASSLAAPDDNYDGKIPYKVDWTWTPSRYSGEDESGAELYSREENDVHSAQSSHHDRHNHHDHHDAARVPLSSRGPKSNKITLNAAALLSTMKHSAAPRMSKMLVGHAGRAVLSPPSVLLTVTLLAMSILLLLLTAYVLYVIMTAGLARTKSRPSLTTPSRVVSDTFDTCRLDMTMLMADYPKSSAPAIRLRSTV